jgi:pimeloyl-ACP methyl ester carboxylesterase
LRKLAKIAAIILTSLLVLLVIAAAAVLGYRTHVQRVNAGVVAIRTPNGIDERKYVEIGGIKQWIQIRGRDRRNPVLCCLHGGPGATWLPLTMLFLSWEKEFTVVQWDQRGAGRTLEATGPSIAPSMSIERMAQDGIEVAEFLREYLHKDKVILLGHSFGSILGIHMVRDRPDLFYAFVGTGQVSNMPKSVQSWYAQVLERARAAKDQGAVEELQNAGPPPFHHADAAAVFFKWLGAYASESDRVAQTSLLGRNLFGAPGFSLRDVQNRVRGFLQVPSWSLWQEILSTDLPALGLDFQVPIFFFQGADDEVEPVKEYLADIRAPKKELVLFSGGGHFAVWTMPDKFLENLVTLVRPLAISP